MKWVYNFDEFGIPMWLQLLFWLLYVLVFVYTCKKTILPQLQNKQPSDATSLFILYFALFAVFYCINPDYFRYREWIYGRDFTFWTKEQVYVHVILFCRDLPFDYPFEAFRLIVWGGAILIVYLTFRLYREQLLPGLTLLFLFVLYSSTFCYARASLGMAIYFLGIAFYLLYKQPVIKLLGTGLAISSYLFHHEMLIGIVVLPCILAPFERKRISILSIVLVIAVAIVLSQNSSIQDIIDIVFDDEELSEKVESINDNEQRAFRLSTFIGYLCYYYPLYLITRRFWKKRLPSSIKGMYRMTFAIVMASIALMIITGPRSVYTYRVLYISMIPMSLIIGYCYYNGDFKMRQLLIMMALALLANSSRFINHYSFN